MDRKSYRACQVLLNMQRKAENEHYHGWPGKPVNAPVETMYPNLVAEMGCGFPWLYLPAEFADVSKEIMAAVLEDNEELSRPELMRLGRCMGVPIGYLTAPEVSFVEPATNKGKARKQYLADLMKQVEGLDILEKWRAEYALSDLESGRAVTYAFYRCAVNVLQAALEDNQRAQHKPRSTRRRATA